MLRCGAHYWPASASQRRQCLDEGFLDAPDDRLGSLQHAAPRVGQRDGVGARIVTRAASLQQALADEQLHDLRNRRTVDAGGVDDILLTEAVTFGRRHQHSVLGRGHIEAIHVRLEEFSGALMDTVEEM